MSDGPVKHDGCGGTFVWVVIICPKFRGFICDKCDERWDGKFPAPSAKAPA